MWNAHQEVTNGIYYLKIYQGWAAEPGLGWPNYLHCWWKPTADIAEPVVWGNKEESVDLIEEYRLVKTI